MSIRFMIKVLFALALITLPVSLLRYRGAFRRTPELETIIPTLRGVVLSMNDDRFRHTQEVLTSLGIKVVQQTPPSYQSKDVDQGLEQHVGSRLYHNPAYLKVWSNRMAFIQSLEEFVQDSSCNDTTWRLFFEDDIAIHPGVPSAKEARELLAQGLKLAERDGFIYLGMCGAQCELEGKELGYGVNAARCAGTCAHAFGFQQKKAGQFLTEMSGLTLTGIEGPIVLGFYFDRYMYEYARQVQKVWVVGSNLVSPVRNMYDHVGILYQDRAKYPTTIGK